MHFRRSSLDIRVVWKEGKERDGVGIEIVKTRVSHRCQAENQFQEWKETPMMTFINVRCGELQSAPDHFWQ